MGNFFFFYDPENLVSIFFPIPGESAMASPNVGFENGDLLCGAEDRELLLKMPHPLNLETCAYLQELSRAPSRAALPSPSFEEQS